LKNCLKKTGWIELAHFLSCVIYEPRHEINP